MSSSRAYLGIVAPFAMIVVGGCGDSATDQSTENSDAVADDGAMSSDIGQTDTDVNQLNDVSVGDSQSDSGVVDTASVETGPRIGPAPVLLGTAGNYVMLAKSAISTVPPSAITGN